MRANPLIDKIYKTLSGNESEKVSESTRNIRLATCKSCKTKRRKKNGFTYGQLQDMWLLCKFKDRIY